MSSVLHSAESHGPNSGTPLSSWPLLSLAANKDPTRGGHISYAIPDCSSLALTLPAPERTSRRKTFFRLRDASF